MKKLLSKKFASRIIMLMLAFIMIFTSVGCGSKSPTAVSFGNTEITSNMFCYWISKYKAMYLYSMVGTTTDNPQYWTMDMGEGVTLGDFAGAMAISSVMQNAVMLELFDEYKLTLPNDKLNAIDQAIETHIQNAGSKAALNSALSVFGVNANILKEIYIAEAKIQALNDYLYGENGTEKATPAEIDDYFKQNYYRMKHILIRTDVKYVKDENGIPIVDEETQTYKTEPLTEDEKAAQRDLAKDLELRIIAGEDYESLVTLYSEDTGMGHFEDGYYITSSSPFLPREIINTVMNIKVDEIKSVESSYGISIVKRYELKDKAYETEPYKSELIGDLAATVNTVKLQTLISSYGNLVTVNEAVVASYPLAQVTANFYY